MFQQGTHFFMRVRLSGVNLADVDRIEFLYKQHQIKGAPAKKTSLWKADGTGDAVSVTEGGQTLISIPWTAAETYRFNSSGTFYLQCRIHMTADDTNPPVPIVPLIMSPTLFDEGEIVNG